MKTRSLEPTRHSIGVHAAESYHSIPSGEASGPTSALCASVKNFKMHRKLDFVAESVNVLKHNKCRRSESVLWSGEFTDSSIHETQQGQAFQGNCSSRLALSSDEFAVVAWNGQSCGAYTRIAASSLSLAGAAT